jgi:hypothetical protein
MAVLGKSIIIIKGSDTAVIGGTIANEIQTDCDMIPISSSQDSEWNHYIKGKKGWTAGVSFLMLNGNYLDRLKEVGERYLIKVKEVDTGTTLQGYAYIRTVKVSAAKGTLAQGSWQLLGDGPLATPST